MSCKSVAWVLFKLQAQDMSQHCLLDRCSRAKELGRCIFELFGTNGLSQSVKIPSTINMSINKWIRWYVKFPWSRTQGLNPILVHQIAGRKQKSLLSIEAETNTKFKLPPPDFYLNFTAQAESSRKTDLLSDGIRANQQAPTTCTNAKQYFHACFLDLKWETQTQCNAFLLINTSGANTTWSRILDGVV